MSYTRILICSFLLIAGTTLYGQSSQRADTISMLSQEWKIQELYLHSFAADEKAELDEFIKTTHMLFNSDGSFITRMDTVVMKGKWQLAGQIVTIHMDEGDSFRMKIIALSSTSFNFESRPPDSEKIFSAGTLVPVKE